MPKLPRQKDTNYQKGIISPIIFIIVIILVITFLGWMVLSGRISSKETNQNTSQAPALKPAVDKSDPKWLLKYCREEMAKLPEAPFTFEKKSEIYPTMADTYVLRQIPEEKRYSGEETCQIDYDYKNEIAYPSVGVEYKFDIKYANQFDENVDNLLESKIDKSWKKISPVSNAEGGRPGYSYVGFPLIYTRENPATGTIDYAYYDFGSLTLYASFTTYEK